MQNHRTASASAASTAALGFKYNNRPKRRQSQRPSIYILPGQVAFRVVCHASAIGGVIGCNGAIVSQLRRETGTKIHCEAPVNGSEHWIVIIVGSGSIDKRIVLNDRVDGSSGNVEGNCVECDASASQVALIRVLERMWAVLMEKDGGGGEEEAYCGLLADTSQIGAVLGKGGRNVEWMRRETGAKIRILPPSCGAKGDELVQITGGTLAVKKAVITVSGCLQDCPPMDGYPLLPGKVVQKAHFGNTQDPHAEFFPHLSSMLPPMTGNNAMEFASNGHLSSTDAGDPNANAKSTEQAVVFKMLCSHVAAGGIIGKKGAIIRAIQNETGALIVLEIPSTTSGDRVVTITAVENLESWYSPAQNALALVFARSVESEIEKGHLPGLSDGATVNARLLVPSNFVNCLNGNRGTVLSEMMEATDADIQILERDQISDSISENEVVMQVTGEYKNVQHALFQVTASLRDDLLPSDVLKEVRARSPYERLREASDPRLHQSVISRTAGAPLSPKLQPSKTASRGYPSSLSEAEQDSKMIGGNSDLERSPDFRLPIEALNEVGETSTNGELKDLTCPGLQEIQMPGMNNGGVLSLSNLCQSKKKSVSVRNITVEITVAEDAFVAVYGKDGSNLNNLRENSGAKVDVHDPVEGEGLIVVSGPPEQTRAAMNLLQSFVADQ